MPLTLTSDRLALCCVATVTTAHEDILAAGSYYLAWVPTPDGVPATAPVATATTPASIDAGSATWSVNFGTAEAVALFTATPGEAIAGRWYLIDVSDATAPVELGTAPAALAWAPEPDGYVPVTVSRAATQAYVDAAIAAAGLGTGDVTGPASSTDGGLVAFSGLTGKLLKAGPAIGTTAGTVAAGDDARLSNARTPTAHAASHATGQADALTAANIGAETAGAVSAHNGAAAAHPFSAVDKYRYGGTAGATTEGAITAAGRALLDDADAAAQRVTLSAYRDQTPAAAANVSGAAVAPDFASALTLQWTLTGNVTSLATATGLASGQTGEIIVTIGSYGMPPDPPSGAYKGAWTVTGTRVRIIIEQGATEQYWTADSLEVVA